MAELLKSKSSVHTCTGTVLNAYYKIGEQGKKLIIKMGLHLDDKGMEYAWDTMSLDHEDIRISSWSRRKAHRLSLACGLAERPDDLSLLIDKRVLVEVCLQKNGEFCIRGYEKLDEEKSDIREVTDDENLF